MNTIGLVILIGPSMFAKCLCGLYWYVVSFSIIIIIIISDNEQ